jgi:L-ascorbate metabolism protein UlaG (beta-lactamase superfamily)
MKVYRALAAVLLLRGSALAAQDSVPPGLTWCRGACTDSVQIRFLGAAGFTITHASHTLLTAPLFSNPRLSLELLSSIPVIKWLTPSVRPNEAMIRAFYPMEARGADAILIGHGHYDHALDVPFIAREFAPRAVIYGPPTAINELWGDSALRADSSRLVTIPWSAAASDTTAGMWLMVAGGAFRVMAIRSDHSPSIKPFGIPITFATGRVTEHAKRLPGKSADWKLGETYAYLIDVLKVGTDSVLSRLYFQDAATTPPLGFPPRAVLDEHAINVAMLVVATSQYRPDTPAAIARALQPEAVIGGHWENFFSPMTRPVHLMFLVADTSKFRKAIARELPWGTPLVFPLRQQVITVGISQP